MGSEGGEEGKKGRNWVGKRASHGFWFKGLVRRENRKNYRSFWWLTNIINIVIGFPSNRFDR
jgi:hypothetical protein